MQPNPTLFTWINEICGNLQGEDGLPDRFEVWYAGDDGHERLHTFRINERREDHTAIPQVLTTEVWKVCEGHAATMSPGASVRYAVQCYRSDSDKMPESTHFLLLAGSAVNQMQLGASVASERGQLIRHNEALHGFAMTLMQSLSGRLARDLEDERNARMRAEAQVREVQAMKEDLLDRQHQRMLEARRAEKSEERMNMLLNLASTLAPAIITRLNTNAQKPNEVMARSMMRDQAVGHLLNNLQGPDIEQLVTNLRPELRPALLELLSSYAEDMKSRENVNTAPVHPPSSSNGAHHGQ